MWNIKIILEQGGIDDGESIDNNIKDENGAVKACLRYITGCSLHEGTYCVKEIYHHIYDRRRWNHYVVRG